MQQYFRVLVIPMVTLFNYEGSTICRWSQRGGYEGGGDGGVIGGGAIGEICFGGGRGIARETCCGFPLALGVTQQMYDLFFKLSYCQVNKNYSIIIDISRHKIYRH